MNKNAIQRYAVWARNELIEQVGQRAYQYGVSEKDYGDENADIILGRVLTTEEKRQRYEFVMQIKEHGFQQVVEEVAYTWFNRFVALRFMEVNDYLPTHVRVLSDATGDFSPEILKDVLHLDLPGLNMAKVSELLNANSTEDLYRYILLTQCNALNDALPEMFEKLGSYTEMLLPNNILKPEGVIGRLVVDIPEEDFRDAVQIIGWLYQYYNTEPKQAVFDGLKKNVKITKEKIPAATQLFTPDWIVRYMVENSLGRLWLESHPNDALKTNWKYYLDEAEQTPEVEERLRVLRSQSPVKSPEDIRLIDPCMGSGHILVYAFDVLIQIYISEGYSDRDAAKLILEKNIYGLDIDRRAYQLAYFSLMMKARQYNRRIFTEDIKPQVYYPGGFPDGEEFGSLVKVDTHPPKPELPKDQLTIFDDYERDLRVWNFKRLLAQKYDVVVTNPPYAGIKGLNPNAKRFLMNTYPDSKSNLFAAFIEKCIKFIRLNGRFSLITPDTILYNTCYTSLREKIATDIDFSGMVELGSDAFEVGFGTVVYAGHGKTNTTGYIGLYYDVSDNENKSNFISTTQYRSSTDYFLEYDNAKFMYKMNADYREITKRAVVLGKYGNPRIGLQTNDNSRFVREWYEINHMKFCSDYCGYGAFPNRKWFPMVKGGGYRKWYGNISSVVNWDYDGAEIKALNVNAAGGRIVAREHYFHEGLTWTHTTYTTPFSVRYMQQGVIINVEGPAIFDLGKNQLYVLACLNSVVAGDIFEKVVSSIHYSASELAQFPLFVHPSNEIDVLSKSNIFLSRSDWDSFETSWDFKIHPLVEFRLAGAFTWGENKPVSRISSAYKAWELLADGRFQTLKSNEEELNRIFIDIYGLQDELTPEVEDKAVTVRPADLKREIRSLISYAVGCMFGRYSLDVEGLAFAGGDWDESKYRTYIPDKDNILPICDDEYFDDDIVGRFVAFIRVVYGAESLEENLKFIADALGGKGTPREVIRNYFLNDFYADHCKIYQKRPIYWLFDSGKKNGFKALVYLHRYSRDLLAKLRTDYVHEQQERYRTQLAHIVAALNATATGAERARLLKQQDSLSEQLKEITAYEEKVHHLADQNIEIDLDDGVKKNYAIFADVLAKI